MCNVLDVVERVGCEDERGLAVIRFRDARLCVRKIIKPPPG
jgi:hypothetical protein